ncbi:MAG: hypothetical protein ACK5QB_10460 [Pseudanabaena sp.]|jgi:hypothetical protein
MGWTWRGDSAETLLTQYPELANIQSLTQRWPSLAEAAERLRVSGQLPNVLPENSENPQENQPENPQNG